jgi:hypothetical protein
MFYLEFFRKQNFTLNIKNIFLLRIKVYFDYEIFENKSATIFF